MIVYTPVTRGKTKWLGPYRYDLSEMVDPVGKVVELLLLGSYLEIEEEEEQLAIQIWRDLEGPFKEEFGRSIVAMQTAKRIMIAS